MLRPLATIVTGRVVVRKSLSIFSTRKFARPSAIKAEAAVHPAEFRSAGRPAVDPGIKSEADRIFAYR